MIRVGTILYDTYEVQRLINVGKLAVLVEARDQTANRVVAIKLLHPDLAGVHGAVKRSLREARALMRLQSEHVCRVLDVGVLDGMMPFIVMEYLEGLPLSEHLAQKNEQGQSWSVGHSVDLVLQACQALSEAHSIGLVHRDIKPDNLFLVARSADETVLKVLDFGIAKSLLAHDAAITNDGDILGTPAYMPPEQMSSSKTVDERADIWSIGIVLYELLTGRQPFVGNNLIEYFKQVTGAPMPDIERPLPDGLEAILRRCLQKKAADRYANMAQLATALAPFAGDTERAQAAVSYARDRLGIVDNVPARAAEQTKPIEASE